MNPISYRARDGRLAPQPADLLAFLGARTWEVTLVQDGANVDRYAADYVIRTATADAPRRLRARAPR